jgi:hypothetical protein
MITLAHDGLSEWSYDLRFDRSLIWAMQNALHPSMIKTMGNIMRPICERPSIGCLDVKEAYMQCI